MFKNVHADDGVKPSALQRFKIILACQIESENGDIAVIELVAQSMVILLTQPWKWQSATVRSSCIN
jgi:hypothetical protein